MRWAPGAERYEEQWWRALGLFRVVSLLYAAAVYTRFQDEYAHPVGGWLVLGGMAVWTAVTVLAYRRRGLRRWPLLTADLLVAATAIVVSRPLQGAALADEGMQTLPITWVVAPVVAWALVHGWRAAVPATLVIGLANVVHRGGVTAALLHNTVLVLLAGTLVGYVAALGREAEQRLAEALQVQAAAQERDRLGRVVHDGVLQVLGLVSRRGRELGGEAAVLGQLAGEQEVALRALVADRTSTPLPPRSGALSSRHAGVSPETATLRGGGGGTARRGGQGTQGGGVTPVDEVDLRDLLRAVAASGVSVAAPPTPVLLPAAAAHELHAAVTASLDNVERHAGPTAKAYVLLEDECDAVQVTVRDDGAGFGPDRLAEAAAEGRLGVASSVLGRLRDLGGSARVEGRPGDGVEVVLRLPKVPA